MNKSKKINMKPKEYFEKLLEAVKQEDIENIFSSYGYPFDSSHSHYKYTDCLNPACASKMQDKKSNISNKYNGLKCYKCNSTFSAIDCVMIKERLSFKEAVVDIARRTRLRDEDELDDYVNTLGTKRAAFKLTKPFQAPKKAEVYVRKIASDDILDKVLRIFSKGHGLIKGRDKLSKEHLEYLKNRNLDDQDILDGGYFTIPKSNMIAYVLKALKDEYGIEEENIEYIPGFYKTEKGKVSFKYFDAIGIPIINAKGMYKGIQIRLNKELIFKGSSGKEKKLRYIWLSSDDVPEGCGYGTSPGAPIDVTYPKTDKATWSKNLFITEGKFKAQQLSKATNAIVLSVQGVANWKDVLSEIEAIQEITDNLINRIFVAYDADIAYKEQVNLHATNMSNALQEKFPSIPVLYCIWNPEDGKGMDDLIFNNKLSTVKTIKKAVYDKLYLSTQDNIKAHNVNYCDIPDEVKLKIFIECIYNRI